MLSTSESKALFKIILIIAIAGIILQALFSFSSLDSDYWVKHVDVKFDNKTHTITETITFVVQELGFHEVYKVYAGEEPVLSVRCSDGLKAKVAPSLDYPNTAYKDLICRDDNGLKPGEYTLTAVYRMPSTKPVRWVVFTETPRRVESISTNGEVLIGAALAGEPVVAFYPKADLYGAFKLLLIYINRWAPVLSALFVIALLLAVYKIFGVEPPVNKSEIPEVSHTPPSNRPSYEAALFFTSNPTFNEGDTEKFKRFISALLMEAVVKGVGKFNDDKTFSIVNKNGLSQFDYNIQEILKLFDGRNPSKLSNIESRSVLRYIKAYYKKVNKNDGIYDSTGEGVFFGVLFLATFVAFFTTAPIAVSMFVMLFVALPVVGIFGGYLLGRHKSPEVFRERLLWDSFANLLKNESLIRQYGPKDAQMWGEWLAYAYAFGIPKKKIIKMANIAKETSGFYVPERTLTTIAYTSTALSSSMAPSSSSSGGGLSGGSIGGGFSGGGSFGAR